MPIYYNHEPTGRPCDVTQKYNSRYRDLRTCDPLYSFGFGLSYTTFTISRPAARPAPRSASDGQVQATVTVTNTGTRAGDEVVQLYLHDPVASLSQPVRRLRGFERVTLAPGPVAHGRPSRSTADDFGFYDNDGNSSSSRAGSTSTPATPRRPR